MDVIYSIRPQHCVNILNKIKTGELRSVPHSEECKYGWIYCSKSKLKKYEGISGKLIAVFDARLKFQHTYLSEHLWNKFGNLLAISYETFYDYCLSKDANTVILLHNLHVLVPTNPIDLKINWKSPQNFKYDYDNLIRNKFPELKETKIGFD